MAKAKASSRKPLLGLTGITQAFMDNNAFLKKFLTRFLYREQDIEDVAQEAYLRAYSTEQERGEIQQPKAFLFSIAKNLAINELRRKSRIMTSYLEDCQDPTVLDTSTTVEGEVDAWQSLGIYCEAVADLPEKCRRVYLLRKVHGLSHREIAERLGISRSAVEDHISRGSKSCRNYIRDSLKSAPLRATGASQLRPKDARKPRRQTPNG